MKIRSAGGGLSAGALALLLALGAAGCGKDDNANNTNAARNANTNTTTTTATPVATPTPVVTTAEDTAIKNKAEAALTKAGVTGVTVEVKGGELTLKGEVPTAKFNAAVQAANEAGAKKVNNQLSKK